MRTTAYNLCKAFIVIGVIGGGAAVVSVSLAAGPAGITQKPGLWQLQQKTERMPHAMTSKMCVDATMTERLVDAGQHMQGVTCSKRDIHMRPGGASVDSVCTMAGRTVTTHADITETSPDAFHETISSTMTPAMAGHASSNSTIDGTWQGACPASMKPGDVEMNGMKINMYAAMAGMKHHP